MQRGIPEQTPQVFIRWVWRWWGPGMAPRASSPHALSTCMHLVCSMGPHPNPGAAGVLRREDETEAEWIRAGVSCARAGIMRLLPGQRLLFPAVAVIAADSHSSSLLPRPALLWGGPVAWEPCAGEQRAPC